MTRYEYSDPQFLDRPITKNGGFVDLFNTDRAALQKVKRETGARNRELAMWIGCSESTLGKLVKGQMVKRRRPDSAVSTFVADAYFRWLRWRIRLVAGEPNVAPRPEPEPAAPEPEPAAPEPEPAAPEPEPEMAITLGKTLVDRLAHAQRDQDALCATDLIIEELTRYRDFMAELLEAT